MKMNYEELKDWHYDARRGLEDEIDRLKEKEQLIGNYLRALDATEELLDEIDSQREELEERQREIDSLQAQTEAKQRVIDSLQAQIEAKQREIDMLQVKLEAAEAKSAEIHNYFENGSGAQVFNDKVTGKVTKIKKEWKKKEKGTKKGKKW